MGELCPITKQLPRMFGLQKSIGDQNHATPNQRTDLPM